jgi:large subunit ribosomal protein L31/Ran GTPase-activating protein 1
MATPVTTPSTEGWHLTDQQRADAVERLSANLAALAFFREGGAAVDAERALEAARDIERRAHTAALVSARTTTGHRPAAETTSAYARKMGELAIETVRAGIPGAGDGGQQHQAQQQQQAQHGAAPAAAGHSADGWHDLSGGGRDFLDEEGAHRALAPLLHPDSLVTRVRLSTKSFGAAAAAVAARALRAAADRLTHADLSDVIAGRPEDEALEALRHLADALGECAGLRHLDLSDNALGEKGVRACAGALAGGAGEALEFLALRNVGCSVHACAAVEELVVGGQLKGLHLYNNMSGDEGAAHIARVLARATKMEDFRMVSSRVGAKGGAALARALAQGSELRRLDVSDNPLTSACAPDLAACVARSPKLASLNLNDTSLGDAGVEAVCDALGRKDAASAAALEELELALNEVTARGARALARVLGSGKFVGLKRINLRENELEDEGALALLPALAALPALEHVDLCANQLQRPGAVGVARALAAARGRGGGGPLPLRCLALDENAISEAGVDQLRAIVKTAFGGGEDGEGVLGPLDENDPDAADDDDEEEGEEEGGDGEGDDGGLSAAMAGVKV